MKKIDLHIHTVKTANDSEFTFSIDDFKRYVIDSEIDVAAVTNLGHFMTQDGLYHTIDKITKDALLWIMEKVLDSVGELEPYDEEKIKKASTSSSVQKHIQ